MRTVMILRSWAALGLASLALSGCSRSDPEPQPKPAAKQSEARVERFGAPLALLQTTDLKELLAFPEPLAGKTVLVEGSVLRACSKKGCWLELATSSGDGSPSCRVTFKDYAFFVPTDSAGSRARIEGVLEVKEMSKAHVDHLEAEGARFGDKNPDGTVQEVRLVATGVELTRG